MEKSFAKPGKLRGSIFRSARLVPLIWSYGFSTLEATFTAVERGMEREILREGEGDFVHGAEKLNPQSPRK